MKLTPELLVQAPSALNPVKERQLDLRGKSTEISYQNQTLFIICRVRQIYQDIKYLQLKTLV
jgi:hypothetical protein